jgi:ABC-type polysaccharide/polyol phosphate transport system ATPase subunit
MTDAKGPAIHVSDLSKVFRIYAKPADMFWELLTAKERYRPFWALRNVSFDVYPGQVVGIMGRNGAGKSTLLKIITGTLDRTSGLVAVEGRVSSILELGTGFNSEYSGRENIYLGGLMVGLTRDEILSKMDWIIQFSELEDFIDQPFKTYSTGMQARLTFSTAVCVDPDILIIDEALSVGDARFQRKSFGKIEEFRKSGRTILLVSHDPNTIGTFCDHAILLENGRIFDQGEPQRISKIYYAMLFSGDSSTGKSASSAVPKEEPLDQETEIILDCRKARREGTHGWWIDLSTHAICGDSSDNPQRSRFLFYENDKLSRPGHYSHELIRRYGKGAYSHWGTALYFSTSDNSDPRSNGRVYRLHRDDAEKAGSGTDSQIAESAGLRAIALKRIGKQEASTAGSLRESRIGNGKAEILDFGIWDSSKNRVTWVTSGASYIFYMRVLFYENVEGAVFGFAIRNQKGVDLFGTSTRVQRLPLRAYRRGDLVETTMAVTMWLANSTCFLSFAVADPYADVDVQYDQRFDALQFDIGRCDKIFEPSIVTLDPQTISEYIVGNLSMA